MLMNLKLIMAAKMTPVLIEAVSVNKKTRVKLTLVDFY